jgi:protein-tyrosine sulfotransferase
MYRMAKIKGLLERLWEKTIRAGWYRADHVSEENPVVIGGCARSGTTLMRVMIDTHPNIYCGPETGLLYLRTLTRRKIRNLSRKLEIPEEDLRAMARGTDSYLSFVETLFDHLRKKAGKPRWGDKSPQNVLHLDRIFRRFPDARFIHMIRDGRDTACSLRTFPRYRMVDGRRVELDTSKPLDQCVRRWVHDVEEGMRYRGDPRYFEVKYEDLVESDEMTLIRVFEFLGEPWDERVTKYYDMKSPGRSGDKMPQNPGATQPIYRTARGRWRNEFTEEDKQMFKALAGDLLVTLGYEENNNW